jgi:hypothetical protein
VPQHPELHVHLAFQLQKTRRLLHHFARFGYARSCEEVLKTQRRVLTERRRAL